MASIQKMSAGNADFLSQSVSKADKSRQNGTDFKNVMDMTTSEKDTGQPADKTISKDGLSQNAVQDLKDKLSGAQSPIQNKIIKNGTEVPDDGLIAAVGQLMADIRNLIMDTFQITGEELSGIMGEMNLTDLDLLNQQNITELAAAITGAEDPMALLFQPETAGMIKELQTEILELKTEMFQEFHVSEEEVLSMAAEEVPEALPGAEDMTDMRKPENEGEAEVTEQRKEEAPVNKTALPEAEPLKTEEAPLKDQNSFANEDRGLKHKEEQNVSPGNNQPSIAATILDSMGQAVEAAIPEVDGQDVIRQIVTECRVAINEQDTSFEMQLNPEHLGKIHVQVAAKDGIITANIAAETQAVKEVLESQLITLKESLNEQGIKVEAVEVTIASHEFERNLDGNNSQSGQEEPGGQKRRFRFDVMDAAEDDLSAEEAILKDMMMAGGNQINYMA